MRQNGHPTPTYNAPPEDVRLWEWEEQATDGENANSEGNRQSQGSNLAALSASSGNPGGQQTTGDQLKQFAAGDGGSGGNLTTANGLKRFANYSVYEKHEQHEPAMVMPPPHHNRPAYPAPDAIELGDDFTVFVHRDSPDWAEARVVH